MPRKDYIPHQDDAFNTWFTNYQLYTAAHTAELGLTPAQALEIQTAKATWGLSYSNHIVTRDAARAAAATKDDKRAEGETVIRLYTNFIQGRRETTDAQRQSLGITVPDREPTPSDPEAILLVPRPMLYVDHSQAFISVIHFGLDPHNENKNAKPDICGGVRLWFVIGGAPADIAGYQFLADDTNSPYLHRLAISVPTTVTYRAQWFDKLNRLGPLGDPVTVTVTV